MNISPEVCYQALLTRDRRFDGVFFVAVRSTMIYCRPVCTVKAPASKNCTFYENAASCERDGYRPCLRCRPELAPGSSILEAKSRLVRQAINQIEDGALFANSLDELADELGVTSRHLRRVFAEELGVTPVQFIQTQRLLLAKRLLTDTSMPISQVAMASGFASVRRFNALFVERYRLNPRDLRKSTGQALKLPPVSKGGRCDIPKGVDGKDPDTFMCQLSFRPPYDWGAMLDFLRGRACPGIEFVDKASYYRTVSLDGISGWLSVSLGDKPSTLSVVMSASLTSRCLQVLTRLKRLFDLQANPELIESQLGSLSKNHPGLRVPGAFDPFEVSIRGILGQQVSVKAATSLAGRLAQKFGKKIVTPHPELCSLSPQASVLASAYPEDFAGLGIMPARVETIIAFSKAFMRSKLDLHPGADYEATVSKLMSLPGIGEWTAEYIAMRCLAWPDAFPHGDLGVKKALGLKSKKEILLATEKYRPWRAYAAMHLWKSLETR